MVIPGRTSATPVTANDSPTPTIADHLYGLTKSSSRLRIFRLLKQAGHTSDQDGITRSHFSQRIFFSPSPAGRCTSGSDSLPVICRSSSRCRRATSFSWRRVKRHWPTMADSSSSRSSPTPRPSTSTASLMSRTSSQPPVHSPSRRTK